MGLLGLPVPGPGDAVRAATGAYAALDQAVALVPRITALVGTLEALATRAERVVGEVDAVQLAAAGVIERTTAVIGAVEQVVGAAGVTVERVGHVVAVAEGTVKRVDDVVDGAQVVVGRTGGVVDGATGLLDSGGRLVERISASTNEEELQAIVHLVDTLPQAVDVLRDNVLPVMSTLGTVAPDLRDLLDIASQLNGVIGSVPGFGRIKKRVEKMQADEDGYRADDEPPSSPPARS